jgi:DNA-binding CsgD family transcriptional regulator
MRTQRELADFSRALPHASDRRAESQPSEDHTLHRTNVALSARNDQLLRLLEQQQLEVEALQAFVVAVSRALAATRMPFSSDARRLRGRQQLATLTPRQREVLSMVVVGAPNKRIASALGISQRTVENHRAAIMLRTGSGSVQELAQLALIADVGS